MAIFDLEDVLYSEADIEAEKKADMKAQAQRDAAIKKADAQLHKLITLIGKETQKQPWLTFMENFLKLNRAGELRGGVKKRFLEAVKSGPFQDIRFRVEQELGIERPKARPGGPSPLRGKGAKAPKPPRHEIEARVKENRNNRKTSEKKAKKDK
ncbi:hypothetical protein HYT05_00160 [Candidatus Kaiserbacteria bacterium]|nr:hypothetical protein [Candidatus Kaiserbacteria bacterium]